MQNCGKPSLSPVPAAFNLTLRGSPLAWPRGGGRKITLFHCGVCNQLRCTLRAPETHREKSANLKHLRGWCWRHTKHKYDERRGFGQWGKRGSSRKHKGNTRGRGKGRTRPAGGSQRYWERRRARRRRCERGRAGSRESVLWGRSRYTRQAEDGGAQAHWGI